MYSTNLKSLKQEITSKFLFLHHRKYVNYRTAIQYLFALQHRKNLLKIFEVKLKYNSNGKSMQF